jgi:membrane associated rhomboid family serine protease
MLSDRYYMRRPAFGPFWSATIALLVANVAVFVLQLFLGRFSHFPIDEYFALSLEGVRRGYLWQLVTFQFMHAGILHLVLNCWALFLFGRELEEALGRKSFLALYFSSGIVGGLAQVGAAALVPHFTNSQWALQFLGPTVGASAGVYGLIAAYALLAPNREFVLLLFFVLPINIRAWYILAISALVAVIGLVHPIDNSANAAHIGGMICGIVFIRYAINWQWPEMRRTPAPLPRRKVKVHPGSSALWDARESLPEDEELPAAEFLSREVDPILDKISAHGIQSLTERERRILESARQKMGKR